MNSIVLFVNKRHISTVILTNIIFVSANTGYDIRSYTTNLLFRISFMSAHTGFLSDICITKR